MPIRSGAGLTNQQLIKKFDQRPYMQGAGGSPSAAADTSWNTRAQLQVVSLASNDGAPQPRKSIVDALKEEDEEVTEAVRDFIRAVLEESQIDEITTTASVAGYSLPLGMEPTYPSEPKKKKRRRKKDK